MSADRWSGARGRTALLVAGQALRARPMRSGLLVATLMLGVTAMACVSASSQIAREAVLVRAQLTGGIEPTYAREVPNLRAALPAIRALLVERPPLRLAGTTEVPAKLGSAGVTATVRFVAVLGRLRAIKPYPLLRGGWLGEGTAPSRAVHVVLNAAGAELVERRSPQAVLAVGSGEGVVTPVIIGVVDDAGDQPTLYASFDEAEPLFPAAIARGSSVLLVGGVDPAEVEAIGRRVDAGSDNASPFARTDTVASMQASVRAVQKVFSFIAAVALLVGAVAVLNIGLASLGERVDEFALRRAVGTPPVVLGAIVLSEAAVVALVASAAALAVAVPAVGPAAHLLFTDLPAGTVVHFPRAGAIVAVLSSLGAALLGGLAPAVRASQIPIASVMRA